MARLSQLTFLHAHSHGNDAKYSGLVRALHGFPQLLSLDTNIDACFADIVQLTKLTCLQLAGRSLRDERCAQLAKLPSLHVLKCGELDFEIKAVQNETVLASVTRVECILEVDGFVSGIENVARFASWFPNVRFLNFPPSNDALEALYHVAHLRHLILYPSDLTGAGLMFLSRLTGLTSLRIETDHSEEHMSSNHLLAALCSTGLRQLRRLDIDSECVTDVILASVLGLLNHLTELSVSRCSYVTPASISTFLFAARWLRRVLDLVAG